MLFDNFLRCYHMKIMHCAVSILAITLIMVIAMCLNISNKVADLREKMNGKISEIDEIKNQQENAELKFRKQKEDFLRACAKPDKNIKSAAQIFEESQFAVAITKATLIEEALNEVASPNASGFIIKFENEFYVITAKHVYLGINGKAEKILVHFKPSANGEILNSEPAEILDVCPDHDVGVLKIKNKKFTFPWEPGVLANSQYMRPGDKIFALGSPLMSIFSITEGCIINNNPIGTNITRFNRLIEHSAVSNYGNSGGPIVDDFGKIVGMCSMIRVANALNHTSLAVPSNIIAHDILKIIKRQKINHSKIDANLKNSWELNEFTEEWRTDPPQQKGVIVTSVTFGSDAASSGLKRGDLILECAGLYVHDASATEEMIMLKDANSTIELLVRHENGSEEKINLQLLPLH